MDGTLTQQTVDEFERASSNPIDSYMYTRGNNPTVRALESRMTALEGGR